MRDIEKHRKRTGKRKGETKDVDQTNIPRADFTANTTISDHDALEIDLCR